MNMVTEKLITRQVTRYDMNMNEKKIIDEASSKILSQIYPSQRSFSCCIYIYIYICVCVHFIHTFVSGCMVKSPFAR